MGAGAIAGEAAALARRAEVLLPLRAGMSRPSATGELRHLIATVAQISRSGELVRVPATVAGFEGDARGILQRFMAMVQGSRENRTALPASYLAIGFQATPFGTDPTSSGSLLDRMRESAEPLVIARHGREARADRAYQLRQRLHGAVHASERELRDLNDSLLGKGQLSRAASQALSRVIGRAAAGDGKINLYDEAPVVLLGGSAGYSPARLLMEAGLRRLLIINRDPVKLDALRRAADELGTGFDYIPDGADLLADPARIAATIAAYASEHGAVNLGLFAYDRGKGQELRLARAQLAIVLRAFPHLKRVFAYRSPSIPALLAPDVAAASRHAFEMENPFETLLRWFTGGHWYRRNLEAGSDVPDVVIPEQGGSYWASQVEKNLLMLALGEGSDASLRPLLEAFHSDAERGRLGRPDVWGPIAPVAKTPGMLGNPVIDLALDGADAIGGEIFPAADGAALMGNLFLDVLGVDRPAELAAGAWDVQVSGGLHGLGHATRSLLTQAAAVGVYRTRMRPVGRPGHHLAPRRKTADDVTVRPRDPAQFEGYLRGHARGPLAEALTGATEFFMGKDPQVASGPARFGLSAVAALNQTRVPGAAGVARLAHSRGVAGSVLTTMLRKLMGRDDRFFVTTDSMGSVVEAGFRRPDGAGVAFRPAPRRAEDRSNEHHLTQVIFFGQEWEGQDRQEIGLLYDAEGRTVMTAGPTQIPTEILGNPIFLDDVPNDLFRNGAAWRDLFGISAHDSLAYAVSRILGPAFRRIQTDASLGIDATRALVRNVGFRRVAGARPLATSLLRGVVVPTNIHQARQGQFLDAGLYVERVTGREDPFSSRAEDMLGIGGVRLLVLGNRGVPKPTIEEPFIEPRGLVQRTGGFSLDVTAFDQAQMARYGAVGDPNVLHQRPIVAEVAAQRRGASLFMPGFAVAGQTEGALWQSGPLAGRHLLAVDLMMVRSVLLGRRYRIEMAPNPSEAGRWDLQWIDPDTGKVHVNGTLKV